MWLSRYLAEALQMLDLDEKQFEEDHVFRQVSVFLDKEE